MVAGGAACEHGDRRNVCDMADMFTVANRSKRMSLIRSRGSRSTEGAFLRAIKDAGVIGWRRHLPLKWPDVRTFLFAPLASASFCTVILARLRPMLRCAYEQQPLLAEKSATQSPS